MSPRLKDYSKEQLETMRKEAASAKDTMAVCAIDELLNESSSKKQGDELAEKMMKALNKGNAELAENLLNQGANPNFVDHDGHTPLGVAISGAKDHSYETIIRKLLEKGAAPNHREHSIGFVPDYVGTSPLERANVLRLYKESKTNRKNVFEALIASGADIDHAHNHSYDLSLLHWAVAHGNIDEIKMLLEFGADPNIMNKDGETPAYFIDHRQEAFSRDSGPITPFSPKEKKEMLELLISHGAYIKNERAPTAEEKQTMAAKQLESYNAAKYTKGEKPNGPQL